MATAKLLHWLVAKNIGICMYYINIDCMEH